MATTREREGAAQLFLRLSYERSLSFASMRAYLRHARLYTRILADGGRMEYIANQVDKDWFNVIIGPTTGVAKAFSRRTIQALNNTKQPTKFELDLATYLTENALLKSQEISATYRGEIQQILDEAIVEGLGEREIAKRINERTAGMATWMGRRIGRTEVHGASTYASQEAAKSLSLKLEKEWLTAVDGRERERHADADGERVGMDERYPTTGLMRPGDPSGSAENIINCRCGELYHRVEV